MDRENFLIEREQLQLRMEARRQEVLQDVEKRRGGMVPKLLRTGASLFFGMGAPGETLGWLSSMFWAVLAPVAVGVAQRGGDALVQKIVHGFFAGRSDKSSAK